MKIHHEPGRNQISKFLKPLVLQYRGKATSNLQQAGLKSKSIQRAGRAARGHERQEHLYSPQTSETLSLSSCINLLPLSILLGRELALSSQSLLEGQSCSQQAALAQESGVHS